MSTGDSDNLPEDAQTAWDAYQAMGLSKQSHFGFLQELDQKYKEGGSPSIAENLHLEDLLKKHDEKVKAFNKAMRSIEADSIFSGRKNISDDPLLCPLKNPFTFSTTNTK